MVEYKLKLSESSKAVTTQVEVIGEEITDENIQEAQRIYLIVNEFTKNMSMVKK